LSKRRPIRLAIVNDCRGWATADEHGDRTWLIIGAACIAIVMFVYKFPRTSAVIIAAAAGATVLVRLGLV
jgi:hypothetical protein